MGLLVQMLAIFWCLLVMGHSAGSLRFDVIPPNISPGLTDSLTANCTFSFGSLPDVATILSIIISKAEQKNDQPQSFKELVSLTAFASNQVSATLQLNAVTNGHVSTQEDSFLSLRWTDPDDVQSGLYRCDVNVLDNTGRPKVISTTAEVTSSQPDLDQVIEKLKKLETLLENHDNRQSELERLVKNQNDTILSLQSQLGQQRDTNVALQSQLHQQNDTIVALQSILSQQNKTIVAFQSQLDQQSDTIVALQSELDQQKDANAELHTQLDHHWKTMTSTWSRDFEISDQYNGHVYLLSKQDFINASVSEAICEGYGGYLGEIDSTEEGNFIKDFVHIFSGISHVMLGATDEAREGIWTFRYSGKPLVYTDWYRSEPDYPEHDCMTIYRGQQWKMFDWPCTYRGYHEKFLCEVPFM